MKKTITIIGSGMMGSALAFPAFENGNEVRLVGTPLDKDIIDACRATNQHPKFEIPFPKRILNSATLKGGATLFLTTLHFVLLP